MEERNDHEGLEDSRGVAGMALLGVGCGLGSVSASASVNPGLRAAQRPAERDGDGAAAAEDELNLVIWAGYAEDGSATTPNFDWVTPFEEETGCKVNTTDGVDSANMVSLMATGQYDGVSASGDATLRMIAAGTVAPVNLDLIPNYENVFDGPEEPAAQHGRRRLVWRAARPRRERAALQHRHVPGAADQLGRHLGCRLTGRGQDQHLQLIDLHRRCGAAPQADATRTWASTTSTSSTRSSSTPPSTLLKQQSEIVGEYWNFATDQITSFGSGDMLAGTSWQYQLNTILAEDPDAPVAATLPDEGSTGWSDTWMIASDAASIRAACTAG